MSRLPDFIVIGAQRAGTTSLYDHITRHPNVAAADRKETHYFSLFFTNGPRWYRQRFPGGRLSRSITGEATPYYLFHPAVPDRVRDLVPDARFIVLLRDPVDRAFSQYQLSIKRGWETLSFADAVAAEPQRLAGEEAKLLADPGYRSPAHQDQSYVARGHYAPQLQRWFDRFDRERFLVLSSEAFFADPQATLSQVFGFLGVDDVALEGLERLNASDDGTVMDPDVRDELRATFRPSNEQLYALLGRDFGWVR